MVDLCIFIVLFAISFSLASWILVLSARAVGSRRARLRHGALAAFLTFVCNLVVLVLSAWSGTLARSQMVLIAALLLVMENVAAYAIYRHVFQLSVGRAFVPWGAMVGLSVVELILVIALLRPFAVEAFFIPTGSMAPTIEPGNRVTVNKLLRPRRWDIVAYRTDFQGPEIYCKRVIGLPGERLRFEGGQLYVNDHSVTPPAVLLGNLRTVRHIRWETTHYDEGQTIVLGSKEYFFIGDDAEHSVDSRLLGPSDRSAIIGVADLIYWPLSRWRILR